MNDMIGAQHHFHDNEYVTEWADRFVPSPSRLELFNLIFSELASQIPSNGCVVELGIGPGYLADHLLRRMPDIQYWGVDFSMPMLNMAQERLKQHSSRVSLVQADLVKDRWWTDISPLAHAFVSTWALHDLGSQENTQLVYHNCRQVLQDGGILLNGDFIKPDKAQYDYEPGRFEIGRHIDMLRSVGFKNADCLVVLEEEIESPTAAQNYACFKGVA